MRGGLLFSRAASTVATTWKFGCTLCGRCCASDRTVLVSAQEAAALERHTKLAPSAFVQLTSDGKPSLQTRDGACVFLDDKKQCGVYDARPTPCRTYPFWGEITTPLGWLRESARCEGIGRGADVPRSAVALDVVQTDLALAGEVSTFDEDRALLEDIPDVVNEQVEQHQALSGGTVRWDTPELCVVDSPDPHTGRTMRTLVLKEEPAFSQSVAVLFGEAVVPTELAMPVHQALALALSFGHALPTRVLVIGGGGCSLPLALATVLPDAGITAVELSPGVADAARRFFVPNPRFSLVVGDGADFLRAASEPYDFVVVDAACAGQSPAPALASEAFLNALHAKLSTAGTLAVNAFGNSTSAFTRRVAERFGEPGTAVLDLAVDGSSHTVVFAQKNWLEGVAVDTWRTCVLGGATQLCSAEIVRHAAGHLRAP